MLHQVGVSFDLYISAQRKASHWIRTVYIRQTFRIKIPVTFIFALIALIEFFEHLIYKHGPSHHKVVPTAINLANRGTDRQTDRHSSSSSNSRHTKLTSLAILNSIISNSVKLRTWFSSLISGREIIYSRIIGSGWVSVGGEWRTEGPWA